MIRWNYLLPRMGLAFLVLSLIWVGSRPMLKFALIHSGQAMTGAAVDIDMVHFSIWDGQVELNKVALADPRHPMKNLFQAESAVINLDPRSLMHREFIVREAKLDQIQFGTPRTESGRLIVDRPSQPGEKPYLVNVITDHLESVGKNWMNQVSDRVPQVLEHELHTVQVANDLKTKWPSEYDRLRARAKDIQRRVREFESFADTITQNPLRDIERYQQLVKDIAVLRRQIEETRSQLHRLGDEFQQDRQRLTDARQYDQQSIGQKFKTGKLIDEQMVSQILLGDLTAERLEEILTWIHWFQDSIPDPEKDFYPTRNRGYDVRFRQKPSVVFEKLYLDGEGRLAGRNFDFYGEAFDVSTNPKLYDQPARIKLRGKAETEIVVDATIDRRGSQKIDSFQISCPGLIVPASTLGNTSDFQVNLSAGKLIVDISLKLIDDQLAGTMVFRQQSVSMSVAHLKESIGGQATCDVLNQNLAGVDEFVVAVEIQGNIDCPSMRLQSDLGAKFADSIDGAAKQMVAQMVAQQSERLNKLVEDQVAELNQEFSLNVKEILAILDTEIPVVSRLEELVPKDLELWPKIR